MRTAGTGAHPLRLVKWHPLFPGLNFQCWVTNCLGPVPISNVDSCNGTQCYLHAQHKHLTSFLSAVLSQSYIKVEFNSARKALCLVKEPAYQDRILSNILWDLRLQHRTWELFWTLVSCVAARGAHPFSRVQGKLKTSRGEKCKDGETGVGFHVTVWTMSFSSRGNAKSLYDWGTYWWLWFS